MTHRATVDFQNYKVKSIKLFTSKLGEPFYTVNILNPDDGNEKLNIFAFNDSLAFSSISASQANPDAVAANLLLKEGFSYDFHCSIKFSNRTVDGKFHQIADMIKILSYCPCDIDTESSQKKGTPEIKPIGVINGFGGV
jgi:hypothetical protein